KLQEAEAECRKAVALNSNLPRCWGTLGNALCDQRKYAEALEAHQQMLAHKPLPQDIPATHTNIGLVLVGLGRLDEAVATYKKAIELQPNLYEAHYNLALALTNQEKHSDAIAELRIAIKLQPNNANAHSRLSLALGKVHDYDQALAEAQKAVDLAPDL